MKAFFKTKSGKLVAIGTFLVLLIAAFCWHQTYQNDQILDHKVNSAVTMKTNRAALKEEKDIKPSTKNELIRNKKKALQLGVDKYPNGYLIIPSKVAFTKFTIEIV